MPKHRLVSCKTLLTITEDSVNGPDPWGAKHTHSENIHDFSLCSVNVIPIKQNLRGFQCCLVLSKMVVYGTINLSLCVSYVQQIKHNQSSGCMHRKWYIRYPSLIVMCDLSHTLG